MLKGIIFDLDGVLTFTDDLHYLAWKKMADREGIYFDKEINNRLRGISRAASLEIILERATRSYNEEEKDALCKYKNDEYVKLLPTMTPAKVSEDVRYTLKTLKEKGVKTAVGSSSKNTMTILTNTELLPLFDEIADGTMITKSKPDPEVFLLAAKKLGLDPKECAVVEDAKAGIDAAKAGGFLALGIGDEVKGYAPVDHHLGKLSDLLQYLA